MPRALSTESTESVEVKLQQIQSRVKENLACEGCGAKIITNGRLTCPRCHESLRMHSMQDVACDEQGRWKCQKCPEHGKNPKTLAIGDEIQCRVCPEKTKNKFIMEEPKVTKIKTAVQEKSGPTKLTTAELNELLQRWLKDEKRKNVELGRDFQNKRLFPSTSYEDLKTLEVKIAEVNKRIEELEKAIALNFDPDEFEREFNVPLNVLVANQESLTIYFCAEMRQRLSISKRVVTKLNIEILPRVGLSIYRTNCPEDEIMVSGIETIMISRSPLTDSKSQEPYVRFIKSTRFILIDPDGRITDRDLPAID